MLYLFLFSLRPLRPIKHSNNKEFRKLLSDIQDQVRLAKFFFLDVQPAIKKRQREPREDLITHLIAEGYGPIEILTECVTYSAAGMVTTRKFALAIALPLIVAARKTPSRY